MKDDDNSRQKAHAALEAALDRADLLRRKLTYWEADCLSKALTAILHRKFGLAQSMVNCSLLPPLADWQPPADATNSALATLRAGLAILGGNPGSILSQSVRDGSRRQRH